MVSRRQVGEMARALTIKDRTPAAAAVSAGRIDAAAARVRTASAPLLQLLNVEELIAAGDDPAASSPPSP